MCIKSVKPHDLAVRSGPLNGTRGGGDMKKRQLQIARGPVRKTVTSYQNGRLQKVLLPLLAAGSSLVIPKMIKEEPQDQDEQVPEMQTFKYEEKNQQRAFGAVAGGVQIKQEIDDDDSLMHTDREDHDYMTPLQNIKKEFNNGSDDSDGSDYHGSDSGELDQENPIMKRNRQRMNRIVAADQQQQRKTNPSAGNITSGDGTQVFIKTLLHALECKTICKDNACKKMRLVLGHFLTCRKIKTGLSCQLCSQLIDIVTRHAETQCQCGPDKACPVPMCDAIRAGVE